MIVPTPGNVLLVLGDFSVAAVQHALPPMALCVAEQTSDVANTLTLPKLWFLGMLWPLRC
jgi:hypothetical protein